MHLWVISVPSQLVPAANGIAAASSAYENDLVAYQTVFMFCPLCHFLSATAAKDSWDGSTSCKTSDGELAAVGYSGSV